MIDKLSPERPAVASATPVKPEVKRAPRPSRTSRRPTTQPKRRSGPAIRTLIETEGPTPETPLDHVRLTVGTLAGSHGVRGELRLKILTDTPSQLEKITQVYLGDDATPVKLLAFRFHGDHGLVRIDGVNTPEQAKELSGLAVKIAGTDARPLEEGEYFLFQLIGLQAVNEAGEDLGRVIDLIETGAHDVLVISTPAGGENLLVPNHPEFVMEIAPERGEVIVRPPVYNS